jgi:hypothetical protein
VALIICFTSRSTPADVVVGGRETRQAEGLEVAPVILEQAENVVARPDHLAVIWKNPNIFFIFNQSLQGPKTIYYYVYMLPAAVQDEKTKIMAVAMTSTNDTTLLAPFLLTSSIISQ